jgi:hypothetical protein
MGLIVGFWGGQRGGFLAGYSFVTWRHLEYCLFTKKRFALLSMRSALSLRPKESCNRDSASANKSECLYLYQSGSVTEGKLY